MIPSRGFLKFFTRGYYGRREVAATRLPDKLKPGQRAFYFFRYGTCIAPPAGEFIEGKPFLLKGVVFTCVAYSHAKAEKHFQKWARNNVSPGKVNREKFMGLFTLLLLLSCGMSAQQATVNSGEPFRPGGGIDGALFQMTTDAPPASFCTKGPCDMEAFAVCNDRGHVAAPGVTLGIECDEAPVLVDTDTTSVVLYPGRSIVAHGCIRCGYVFNTVGLDRRVVVWRLGEQNRKP